MTNRECIEKDACNFSRLIFSQFIDFHALLEKSMFVSLFSVRLIKIEIWFDDWLRFDLILQCITRFARDSIMKIRSIVLCRLRVSQMIVSIDKIKKRSRFSVRFSNWFAVACWVSRVDSFHREWCRLKSLSRIWCFSRSIRFRLIFDSIEKLSVDEYDREEKL
jgi:hypothetical protein